MAFNFLSSAANLLTAGAGLVGAFRGREEPAVSREQAGIARQAAEFANLSVSPDDPRFRNLQALFAERNRRANIQAIQALFKTSRRAKARGDVGFGINPERRDESIAQALSRNFQLGAERARDETRKAFLGASEAGTGASRAFSVPSFLAAENERLNAKNLAGGIESSSDILRSLGNLFQQGPRGWSSQRQPEEFWGSVWNSDPRFAGFG